MPANSPTLSYRANPINRCFFCKSNLYRTLSGLADGAIASGTNCDDLADFRPGLAAAANHNVCHPYVEAGMTKIRCSCPCSVRSSSTNWPNCPHRLACPAASKLDFQSMRAICS